MSEVEVTTRSWGNSIGITIPKEIIEKENIKENEKIVIEIKKKKQYPDRRVFGLIKGLDIDSQKLKDELREEWS